MELNIENFEPTIAQLTKLAEEAAAIGENHPLEVIKEARLKLRNARTSIAKVGKKLREDAVAFQRAVIAKEKDLIAIISPQEDRLDEIETAKELAVLKEARRAALPARKEQLALIGEEALNISDEELLEMDTNQFQVYLNTKTAEKNELDRQKIAQQQAELDKEKLQQERKKELEEAEERGRIAAEQRLEQEKLQKEERDRKEKEQQEKDLKYQNFLTKHKYNKQDFYTTQGVDGLIVLWKKVGVFNPNDKT